MNMAFVVIGPGWTGSNVNVLSRRLAVALAGLVVGASMTAVVLYVLAQIVQTVPLGVRLPTMLVACACGLLVDLGVVANRLPVHARMIPQEVFSTNFTWGTFRFGVQLGSGVRTYITSTGEYLVGFAAVVLAPGLWATLVMAAGFALGRFLTLAARVALQGGSERWGRYSRFLDDQIAPIAVAAMFVLLGTWVGLGGLP